MKNLHIEHFEDLIFEQNGIKNVLSALPKLNKFCITTKYDGAPAIVFGVDPETKKFFVATKSVFNKVPKVCYTEKDVDKLYPDQPELCGVLKLALSSLKSLKIKNIVQGDLLFTRKDLDRKQLNGIDCVVFTPNIITYAIPYTVEPEIGIAIHTEYTGDKLTTLTGKFCSIESNKKVWIPDMAAKLLDLPDYSHLLKYAAIKLDINTFDDCAYFKRYVNHCVKTNETSSGGGLQTFIKDKYKIEIDKLKTYCGKTKKTDRLNNTICELQKKNNEINMLFEFHSLLTLYKLQLLRRLKDTSSVSTYHIEDGKYVNFEHEGYVIFSKNSCKFCCKLVNRLKFSKLNFIKND